MNDECGMVSGEHWRIGSVVSAHCISRRSAVNHCLTFIIVLAALLLAPGCATNPVTGESDLVLMSEATEIRVGRQSHPEVIKQYGRYDMPTLQAHVQQVGEQLAANSHRSNLIYRFTVLDSPEVNAFALPGGYIYVTRGLLAYLNSEAELAAVLGHEIGHVTARHAVRQHSAATVTGVIGSVIATQTGVHGAQELLNVLGTAIVRGYGREHELEADRLGAEYLARSGYDPQAMIGVIRVLKSQELFEQQLAKEEKREPRVYHGLFATHPDNDQRLQEVVASAARFKAAGEPRLNRDGYLRTLDGLTFGPSEREGVVRGNRFYHKELGFALRFPEQWHVDNLPTALLAKPPANDGLLHIGVQDLNKRISPREFMIQRLKLDDLHHGEAFDHGGLLGYTAVTEARTPFGRRQTRVTVLYFNTRAFIFSGATKDPEHPFQYDSAFLDTARSFHALTEAEKPLATALRLRIILARAGTAFAALARESRIPSHPEAQLRLLNGYYPQGEPAPGLLIKIVE